MNNRMTIFACVTIIIGFMVAVQFQAVSEPENREGRNMAELRQDLVAEKEKQQRLNEELERQREILYQLEQTEDVEEVMGDVITELQEQAGLTEVSGPGIILKIDVAFDVDYEGGAIRSVPPYLVRLLINELNIQGATHIAIDMQRYVATTAIREANGRTLVNGSWLSHFPLEIKVVTDDPESMHHAMMSSQSRELFSYENLSLVSTPVNQVELPAYEKDYRVRFMEPVQEGS
ncbi:DUF881 domain-containing protein [Salipaludibacillus sp. CF4.18]|uniref:DUF881 domain-containing protein n=1 Tax=Salipaludibacillus sp. CF4.18 TaxID=3373081 RepID=UPI003EE73DD9